MSTTESGRKPRRADARRNYEQLLATAHELFAEHGTDASLEEVARRAGVGIGTLYRHFPTRDALLEALVGDRFDKLHAEAGRLLAAHPPAEALEEWLRRFIAGTSTYRGLVTTVMADAHGTGSELDHSCARLQKAGSDLVFRAQHAGAIRRDVAAGDVLAMAAGISWVSGQAPDGDDRTRRLLDLLMSGIRL
ncbi:helix-turn-helix domain-containing protein [Amycolatopsis minnesotensis]|uniref:TetR/AcrR family transcriptional regulator n=1 Tax=Amycolatopsis minnesotensis TaxID=337894 RepID=A0ABN2Q5B2_9PSEU